MLIRFSVTNFKSIKNTIVLDMASTAYKEHRDKNVFSAMGKKFELLKSACIYGPNAGGKSNLIQAMGFMRNMVVKSAATQIGDAIKVVNFKFSSETEKLATDFEICFIVNGKFYRYGFSADRVKVHKEYLYGIAQKREVAFFKRDSSRIAVFKKYFKEGVLIADKTRPNALFLSVAAQFNGEVSKEILGWFRGLVVIRDVLNDTRSIEKAQDQSLRANLLSFLQAADLGIEGLEVQKRKILGKDDLPKGIPAHIREKILLSEDAVEIRIWSRHSKYNSQMEPIDKVDLPFGSESRGTNKMFSLFGYLHDSLNMGHTLVVDELETSLHPMLSEWILGLYNSRENAKNAQLVFTTHDLNLLDKSTFRRDQVWFIEKNKYGESKLFSLADYGSKVRNDATFAKDYMFGKYGAIPLIKKFAKPF